MIKRTLWTLVLAALVVGSGCQHHNLASNGCGGCATGGCGGGACGGGCNGGACGIGGGGGGGFGRGGGGGMGQTCGRAGCRGQCGMAGCLANARGHLQAGRPARVGQLAHPYDPTDVTPGPQTGTYAYPYYTSLGPRDFLMANPPSIGR